MTHDPIQQELNTRNVKVLLVEDDEAISMGLQINLEKEGYDVSLAHDGEAGLHLARTIRPNLVVLDVMLPKKNGLEVLNLLRREGYDMPIIILSARSAEMDKVTGLELGAEDYIAKPFSLAEFMARVRVALRRVHKEPESSVFRFADICIDPMARSVMRNGALVDITQTEFDILICLLKEPGKVLTRHAIFKKVWGPNHHGTPRTIDNFIQQLRAKLEVDAGAPKHFLTVRGVGYRFQV